MSIFPIESARDVEGLPSHMCHEECFRERLALRIILNHVSGNHHMLHVLVRDFSLAHALLGMSRDQVAILSECFSQGGYVELGNGMCHQTALALLRPCSLPTAFCSALSVMTS